MTKTSAINRIHELLDDNSFVEVGAYITARSTDYNMQSQETPADGVVTGYGTINGALVYVYSQDASVMGGSIGEMHAEKIEKLIAQRAAAKKEKNFAEADRIRGVLADMGVTIKDTRQGTQWSRN